MQTLSTPPAAPHPARLTLNPHVDNAGAYPDELRAILSLAAEAEARREIASWPGYTPTPLRDLAPLAREFDLAAIAFKEEHHRFGLRSFKALGGAYAVRKRARARRAARGSGLRDRRQSWPRRRLGRARGGNALHHLHPCRRQRGPSRGDTGVRRRTPPRGG